MHPRQSGWGNYRYDLCGGYWCNKTLLIPG